ncbi:YybS family protein [Halobacillus litoralis]|uniref:YybS family protein n=1 Tax=Halobacillus litoralis TaxID=45668 RepID=UPI001CFD1801|nr:YybS family protein [Halobacillus litoralis]
MNNTKRLTEGALMTGIYLLLLLVIIFMPGIVGSLLLLVLPVPFVLYSYRHGWKSGLLMFISATVFTILFANIVALPFTLLAGVGGIALGGTLNEKRSPYETLAIGSIGFIFSLLSTYLLIQMVMGVNLADEVMKAFDQSFAMSEGIFSMLGQADQMEARIEELREFVAFLPDLIPSILVMTGVIFAFVSQWLSYKLINRIENKSFSFTKFNQFRLPTSILWYYLLSMILNMAAGDGQGLLYLAAINVMIVTGTLLVIQGFSFVFYYASVKNWSKAIPILVVVFSLLLPGILLYLVRILGIIDTGFPLRDRIAQKKES